MKCLAAMAHHELQNKRIYQEFVTAVRSGRRQAVDGN
jgi:hypothetical protein